MPTLTDQIFHRQSELKTKRSQNTKKIQQILLLKSHLQHLKWQIPQTSTQQPIQQLKQSIKIPLPLTKIVDVSLDEIVGQEQKLVMRDTERKIIKEMENKKDMLMKLDKLRIDGNLYTSHRRVILKEYLQQLRQKISVQKSINEKFHEQGLNLDKMKSQYEGLMKMYEKSSGELQVSRML